MLRGDREYGAQELNAFYQRSMARSLGLSVVLHLAIFSAFYGVGHTGETSAVQGFPAIVIPISQTPPRIIQGSTSVPNRPSGARRFIESRFAIPLPAPIGQADSSRFDPGQPQGSGVEGDSIRGWDGGNGVIGYRGIDQEDIEPPPFVPWEKEPQIVKRVEPRYPDLAIRTGIEGLVNVNVWVDKQGKVRKVKVVKSSAEIFNASVIEAASKWIFTPAVMQKGPVAVWVSLPFSFRLNSH